MRGFNFLGFVSLLVFLTGCRETSNPETPSVPTFDRYPAKVCTVPLVKKVNLSSHPQGRLFRTVLRKGYAKGPNFANYMTVVTVGCGTSCQHNWIIDGRTGKIIDRLESTDGVAFKKDSDLLVINPTHSYQKDQLSGDVSYLTTTKFLQWDGTNLKPITEIKLTELLDKNIILSDK